MAADVNTHIGQQSDQLPAIDSELRREIVDPRFTHYFLLASLDVLTPPIPLANRGSVTPNA
jgi:hypothetical protein